MLSNKLRHLRQACSRSPSSPFGGPRPPPTPQSEGSVSRRMRSSADHNIVKWRACGSQPNSAFPIARSDAPRARKTRSAFAALGLRARHTSSITLSSPVSISMHDSQGPCAAEHGASRGFGHSLGDQRAGVWPGQRTRQGAMKSPQWRRTASQKSSCKPSRRRIVDLSTPPISRAAPFLFGSAL